MKTSFIFGTRPEAIKLAPVILAAKADPRFKCKVCVTAQHREMLDQVLKVFKIKPDVDLNLMRPNQTLAGLTARAISAIDTYLAKEKPDMVIVQGDTTTVFCAALCAFYQKYPSAMSKPACAQATNTRRFLKRQTAFSPRTSAPCISRPHKRPDKTFFRKASRPKKYLSPATPS